MGFQELVSSLGENPYFGAGFGLFGLGAGTAVLRKGYMIAAVLFRRHYMTSLEVSCKDVSYTWLLNWITKEGAKNTQHLSAETKITQSDSGKISTKQDLLPCVGEHFFWYKNALIRVERNRENQSMNLHSGMPFETVKLTTFGRKRALFEHILNEAKSIVLEESAKSTIMYTPIGADWRMFGHPRNRRPLSSVVLNDGVADEIVKDVQEFIDSSMWYLDRGIPYRRGYLLHGPPGCGKSSFITALAGHLQLGVCVLSLSDRGLTDDRLSHLLAVAPESSIILLEDIDAAFVSREDSSAVRTAYEGLTPVTLSGLLNCLDGVASTEARIVFMTTNYIDRLDPALIRPGRVDVIKEISYCGPRQLEQLFIRFFFPYNHQTGDLSQLYSNAAQFAQNVLDLNHPVSPAEIQGHFQLYKNDPEAALNNVVQLRKLNRTKGRSLG